MGPTDLTLGFTVWPRYLLDHGANIAAVNSDGDVPLDIAEADNMETLLRSEIGKRGKELVGCHGECDSPFS